MLLWTMDVVQVQAVLGRVDLDLEDFAASRWEVVPVAKRDDKARVEEVGEERVCLRCTIVHGATLPSRPDANLTRTHDPLAMQKVEGSSPFIRSRTPVQEGYSVAPD